MWKNIDNFVSWIPKMSARRYKLYCNGKKYILLQSTCTIFLKIHVKRYFFIQVKIIVRMPQTCSHVFIDLKDKNRKSSIVIIQSNLIDHF